MSREEIISIVVKVVVLVIAALIGRYLIPWIKGKVGNDKLELVKKWALIFVNAAENTIKGEKKGAERREAVMGWLSEKAGDIGLILTVDDVRSLLENAYNIMIKEQNK